MNLNFILQAIGKIWLTSCTALSFSFNLRAALTSFAIKIIIPITQIPIQTTSIQSATKEKKKVVLNIQIPLRFGLVRAILKAVLVFFRNDRLSLVFYVGRIYFKLIPGQDEMTFFAIYRGKRDKRRRFSANLNVRLSLFTKRRWLSAECCISRANQSCLFLEQNEEYGGLVKSSRTA